jgi:hypothetical protein
MDRLKRENFINFKSDQRRKQMNTWYQREKVGAVEVDRDLTVGELVDLLKTLDQTKPIASTWEGTVNRLYAIEIYEGGYLMDVE